MYRNIDGEYTKIGDHGAFMNSDGGIATGVTYDYRSFSRRNIECGL